MALWRAEAIERLPELRKTIESGDSVMRLWIDLLYDFDKAYEREPRNESLIARIYSFADWCVAAPRGPDASHDPLSAVAVCFYEHVPRQKRSRDDMPRWFLASEVEFGRSTFSYLLEPEEFVDLLKHQSQCESIPRARGADSRGAGGVGRHELSERNHE